jgi:hypothetical protein
VRKSLILLMGTREAWRHNIVRKLLIYKASKTCV